jgi:hypothetical protein
MISLNRKRPSVDSIVSAVNGAVRHLLVHTDMNAALQCAFTVLISEDSLIEIVIIIALPFTSSLSCVR